MVPVVLKKRRRRTSQNNMAASAEHVDPESAIPEETRVQESSRDLDAPDSGQSDPDPDEGEDGGEPPGPKIRDTPEDIRLEAIANTVALHPNRDIVVFGDVDGDVYVFSYSCTEGGNRELWSSGHHLKSCRQVRFSADGRKLLSVSRDKAVHLLDVERGQLETRIRGAHQAPINSLLVVDENILATGDDAGSLKVRDRFPLVPTLGHSSGDCSRMSPFVLFPWGRLKLVVGCYADCGERVFAGLGLEEGERHHGRETPRGLHQRHHRGPGQEDPAHGQVGSRRSPVLPGLGFISHLVPPRCVTVATAPWGSSTSRGAGSSCCRSIRPVI